MRRTDIRRIAVFFAIAAAVAGFHRAHDGKTPADHSGAAAAAALQDPLAPELARCRALGMAAQDDAACVAAWAENRRRFFDYSALSPDEAAR